MVFQTIYANKDLFPLPYDSGGVTTSTVTVPSVTALGLCLASTFLAAMTVSTVPGDRLRRFVSDDVDFGLRANFQPAPLASEKGE